MVIRKKILSIMFLNLCVACALPNVGTSDTDQTVALLLLLTQPSTNPKVRFHNKSSVTQEYGLYVWGNCEPFLEEDRIRLKILRYDHLLGPVNPGNSTNAIEVESGGGYAVKINNACVSSTPNFLQGSILSPSSYECYLYDTNKLEIDCRKN